MTQPALKIRLASTINPKPATLHFTFSHSALDTFHATQAQYLVMWQLATIKLKTSHSTPHCALRTSHFTLHTLRSALNTPHSTLYTPQFALNIPNPRSTIYNLPHSPHCVLQTLHSTLCTPHSTPHTLHLPLPPPHSTPHTLHLHSRLHTPHFTLYMTPRAPHSTLPTPNFSLYASHSTLCTPRAPHSTPCALHLALSTLRVTFFALHSITFRTFLCSLHFTLHTPQSPLYTLHSTPHISHFTIHTLHSTLYSPQLTLHTLHPALGTLPALHTPHLMHFTS